MNSNAKAIITAPKPPIMHLVPYRTKCLQWAIVGPGSSSNQTGATLDSTRLNQLVFKSVITCNFLFDCNKVPGAMPVLCRQDWCKSQKVAHTYQVLADFNGLFEDCPHDSFITGWCGQRASIAVISSPIHSFEQTVHGNMPSDLHFVA